MIRLSHTAIRDLAAEVGLPDYIGEDVADRLTEGDGFADEHLVTWALLDALDEIREG